MQSGNRRFVNYTGVSPGTYLFKVKGSNNDGAWNEEGTYLHITISPPPWKTWWAYSFYVIVFITILVAIRLYYLKRQHLKQSLELEKVEKEKLDELDKMKSRFFANISHEFRTPLTLILGPIEKAIEKAKNKNIQNDLNIAQRNAKRLQVLINELLSLSKLESGKLKLHVSKYDIVRLVKDYSQLFESMAKHRNIEIEFKSNEKEIPVYVDRDKLEKILNNLLSNAFKFTDDGGRIDIEIVKHLSDVVINISDNGKGIPPDKLPFIFDRFYQANESLTKEYEGSGIGLALTKELVELHNGKITALSDKEKGTTFSISFPLGRNHINDGDIIPETTHEMATDLDAISMIEDLKETPPAGINEIPSELDPRPVVLVVEDNYDLMASIRESLEETYQVLGANNGLKGLEKAVNFIPDLIVSDVMMPEMDGFVLSKKIKSNEHTSHIPLILLTAKAGKEDKMIGLETGADDFITKPFDHDELLVRIKNLIVQRKKLTEHILKNISPDNQLSTSGVSSMEQKFLKKAINAVANYISDSEFSVELFAKELSMSRVQLHRKLTALVGQSARDFIRTIRLKKAAQLLKKNSGTVSEIAYDVGFSNPSHFSKCFREQFGKLPSEYSNLDTY